MPRPTPKKAAWATLSSWPTSSGEEISNPNGFHTFLETQPQSQGLPAFHSTGDEKSHGSEDGKLFAT